MTDSIIYSRKRFRNTLTRTALENASQKEIDDLCLWLNSLRTTEARDAGRLDFKTIIKNQFAEHLQEAGFSSGRIAEIGGPFNSFASEFPEFEFEYLSLYPIEGHDEVIVADITQCDYIESERFDAIFSVS
ncbi:MAG: hypothetical protein GY743_22905, partial [Planctomycetaceae bacterium]|nr:hypothetical protein [Planctomycetaceae bacterium]